MGFVRAAALAGLVVAWPVAAGAAELRMVSGFPINFTWTEEILKPFIAAVQDSSGGEISIAVSGPDTIPTFEQFEPVQAGVFDLLFTHPAYHSGTTSVGLAIDAIAPDPEKRREAGIIDAIDRHYAGLGMKLIAAPATGTKGFRYYLRDPLDGTPGFDGRKIRGTVSYHPMIRALGGSPVNLPGGEVYSALQSGVIDGAAWGTTGASDFKWHEVATYVADPAFGQVGVMIFMNLDAFEALSPEQQAVLLEEGRKIEIASMARYDVLAEEELARLQELGMELTAFDPSEAAQLEDLWANGVWEVAIEKSGADAEALRALALEHGMTR